MSFPIEDRPPENLAEIDVSDQDFVTFEAFEAQNRLWVRTLIPLLQIRSAGHDASGRVQFALDRMQIAACERITRLLSADLPTDPA